MKKHIKKLASISKQIASINRQLRQNSGTLKDEVLHQILGQLTTAQVQLSLAITRLEDAPFSIDLAKVTTGELDPNSFCPNTYANALREQGLPPVELKIRHTK